MYPKQIERVQKKKIFPFTKMHFHHANQQTDGWLAGVSKSQPFDMLGVYFGISMTTNEGRGSE